MSSDGVEDLQINVTLSAVREESKQVNMGEKADTKTKVDVLKAVM